MVGFRQPATRLDQRAGEGWAAGAAGDAARRRQRERSLFEVLLPDAEQKKVATAAQINNTTGGNPNLQPETADTYTVVVSNSSGSTQSKPATVLVLSPMTAVGWLIGWRLTFGGEDIGWEGALATIVEDPNGNHVGLMSPTDPSRRSEGPNL